jgi:hypothetical protein
MAWRFVMKGLLSILVGSTLLAAIPFSAGAQHLDHQLITPDDMKWGAGPPSLPTGAQAVVLYGDPAKEGMFAFRLKRRRTTPSRRTRIQNRKSLL